MIYIREHSRNWHFIILCGPLPCYSFKQHKTIRQRTLYFFDYFFNKFSSWSIVIAEKLIISSLFLMRFSFKFSDYNTRESESRWTGQKIHTKPQTFALLLWEVPSYYVKIYTYIYKQWWNSWIRCVRPPNSILENYIVFFFSSNVFEYVVCMKQLYDL